MIWAPISRNWIGVTALTVPCVPTGMKMGVSTTPWGVVSRPRRAAVAGSVWSRAKCADMSWRRFERGAIDGNRFYEQAADVPTRVMRSNYDFARTFSSWQMDTVGACSQAIPLKIASKLAPTIA